VEPFVEIFLSETFFCETFFCSPNEELTSLVAVLGEAPIPQPLPTITTIGGFTPYASPSIRGLFDQENVSFYQFARLKHGNQIFHSLAVLFFFFQFCSLKNFFL
jgi:hypothetical protein